MKQIIYSCDRCKQAYTPYKSQSGMMGVQLFKKNLDFKKTGEKPYEFGRKKYLCPDCMADMESWYFEEVEEPEEDESAVDLTADDE